MGVGMWRPVLASVVLLLFLGCARNVPESAGMTPGERGADVSGVNRYLAYEHAISVSTEAGKVAALVDSAQAACREAADEACAILQANITRGDGASATLKFRAKSG